VQDAPLIDLETPKPKDEDSALESKTTERKEVKIRNWSSHNSDSIKISLGSNESPSKRDGWLEYRKVVVLGEGSYGKVYKVLKRAIAPQVINGNKNKKKQSIFDDPLQMSENAAFPSSPHFLVIKEL